MNEVKGVTRKEYKGWQYVSDPSLQGNKSIAVIPPSPIEEPEFLYKYYGLSKNSIRALKNRYIYASCPLELNDPFDSMNLLIDYRNVTDERKLRFFDYIGMPTDEIEENKDFLLKKYHKVFAAFLFSGMGIISVTPDGTNPLMWAHYCNAHEGFAVKFKNDKLKGNDKLAGPYPINYQNNWQPVDYVDSPPIAFLYQTNIKDSKWEYENEWRYVALGQNMYVPYGPEKPELRENRKFGYDIEAIDEVVLGFRFVKNVVSGSEIEGVMVLDFENVDKSDELNAKKDLLKFIHDNQVKCSRIVLKEGSSTFELDTMPIKVVEVNSNVFHVTDFDI